VSLESHLPDDRKRGPVERNLRDTAALMVSIVIGLTAIEFSANAQTARLPTNRDAYDALRPFLGDLRGDYIHPWKPAHVQIGMALGVPDEVRPLGGGVSFVSGCRPRSCFEKAAVVLSAKGEALAVGVIHYNCHLTTGPRESKRRPNYGCEDDAKLTMFLTRDGAYRTMFESWADKRVKEGYFRQANYLREIVWMEPKAGKGGKAQPNRVNE
jgi:hypothetical protein